MIQELSTTDKFVKTYLSWLKENITSCTFENGITEITVPFLDQHNDFMQIYVTDKGNGTYELSDDGVTLYNLEISGVNINTPNRIDIFNKIINGYGVQCIDNELIINCDISRFPQCKNMLIQAMHSVSDMFMLSRNTVKNVFLSDVTNYLSENNIPYISDVQFSGKSGLIHKFDFALPKTKTTKERLINTANRLDIISAKLNLLSFIEVSQIKDFEFVVIYNDTQSGSSEQGLSSLKPYDAKLIPWSEIGQNSNYLRGIA